tara:strand:- start:239 stop:448 length:210 start_codon:yes stop_codon:yes gene_type:complete
MLSSTRSRRILHVISVTLALLVFGYGLFLKYTKNQNVPAVDSLHKTELVKNNQMFEPLLEEEQGLSEPD